MRHLDRTPTDVRRVTIIEHRYRGHYLAYVAAIMEEAERRRLAMTIVTTFEARQSLEWGIHLSDIATRSGVDVVLRPMSDFNGDGLVELLEEIRGSGSGAVLPSILSMMRSTLRAYLTRRMPRPTTAIAMVPLRLTDGTGDIQHLVRIAILWVMLRSRRTIEVLLLENPLNTEMRWGWPLSLDGARLDDPSDLIVSGDSALPPEIGQVPPTVRVFAIVGFIDARKHAVEAIEAWVSQPFVSDRALVVGGTASPLVRECLSRHDVRARSDVVFIDRALTQSELDALLDRSWGIAILYADKASSGFLIAAAARGRWVLTLEGLHSSALASNNGFGIAVRGLDAESICEGLNAVLTRPFLPPAIALPTRRDFGARVMRQFGHSQIER